MRRLFVALGVLVTLAFTGPTVIVAQDAAPTDATDARYLVPFTPDGLNPGLTAAEPIEGVCAFESISVLGRGDAWDCTGANNRIYDPCFENPFTPPDEPGQVACFDSPFTTDVTLINLTEPLVRQKEAPDPSGPPAMDMPETGMAESLETWDLPWALELANGDQCTLLHGTLIVVAGETVHYGCTDGGMILGETHRGQPLWTVSYLAEGDFASSLVAVTAAWS